MSKCFAIALAVAFPLVVLIPSSLSHAVPIGHRIPLAALAADPPVVAQPPASVDRIRSRAEFDALAAVSDYPYLLPHVLFVIDRQQGNRMYYINSHRFKTHREFVNGTYLSLEGGQRFFNDNYLNPNRRFIMGTLAYQTPIHRWAFEFWEGDAIPASLLRTAADGIRGSFFAPVAFKSNSSAQDAIASSIDGLSLIRMADIGANARYQALDLAASVGRIHLVSQWTDDVVVAPDDIVVADSAPVTLPPVAGIITTHPSTPLSHVNLRAIGIGIPDAFIQDAGATLKRYDGQLVYFETKRDQYLIGHPSAAQLAKHRQLELRRQQLMTPRGDLTITKVADLSEQRSSMVVVYGAKSANLGEMMHAGIHGATIPDGFTIPFYYYDAFLRSTGLRDRIVALLHDPEFIANPKVRRRRLEALRAQIQAAPFDIALQTELLQRAHAQFPGKGLYVRSSTNSEDLPNFNGAGLYSTVPNATTDDQLIEAVKTVWASVWNFEAYEARQQAGIDHMRVYMGVLIQEGINAECAGVMITTDPYNNDNHNAIDITAKRGLGTKVAEGAKVAEQVLFHPTTNAVQVLTRSGEDSLLVFDPHGGLTETPIVGSRVVLTDDMVRRLADAALQIKQIFHGRDQDIEWCYRAGQLYIVQSRPFINANAGG